MNYFKNSCYRLDVFHDDFAVSSPGAEAGAGAESTAQPPCPASISPPEIVTEICGSFLTSTDVIKTSFSFGDYVR